MQIKTRYSGYATILTLSGRFDNHAAPAVVEWLDHNVGLESPNVIVNLSDVSFVDSMALATLVQGMKRCRQIGGEMYLCGLQHPVYMIFELTRLDKAFTIFVDEQHALRALEQ